MLVGNFSSVIFVLAGPMGDGWEDHLSVGGRIASKLVGNELPWWAPLVFQHLAKEAFVGSLVSMACDKDIEDIPVLVHRSPKIRTFAADCDEHFVHVPDVAESTLSSPQSACVFGSKFPAPGSNGFVGYGDATLREKVLDISKAQSEAMVQPDGYCQVNEQRFKEWPLSGLLGHSNSSNRLFWVARTEKNRQC